MKVQAPGHTKHPQDSRDRVPHRWVVDVDSDKILSPGSERGQTGSQRVVSDVWTKSYLVAQPRSHRVEALGG